MTREEKLDVYDRYCESHYRCVECGLSGRGVCVRHNIWTDKELDDVIQIIINDMGFTNEEHRMTVADIDKVLNRGYWVYQPKKRSTRCVGNILPDELKDMVVAKVGTCDYGIQIEVADG